MIADCRYPGLNCGADKYREGKHGCRVATESRCSAVVVRCQLSGRDGLEEGRFEAPKECSSQARTGQKLVGVECGNFKRCDDFCFGFPIGWPDVWWRRGHRFFVLRRQRTL